jgi:hypothetical protein
MSTDSLPLLQHALESPSAFTPERLMQAVRAERRLAVEVGPTDRRRSRARTAAALPSIVVIDEAVRDEGTSLHYLPPSETVATPTPRLVGLLKQQLGTLPSPVRRGAVWTTDAPYRETPEQLRSWAERGVLAVEMQAASLSAFARAREAYVGTVALASNRIDQVGGQFDTGGHEFRVHVLAAVARAAQAYIRPSQDSSPTGIIK